MTKVNCKGFRQNYLMDLSHPRLTSTVQDTRAGMVMMEIDCVPDTRRTSIAAATENGGRRPPSCLFVASGGLQINCGNRKSPKLSDESKRLVYDISLLFNIHQLYCFISLYFRLKAPELCFYCEISYYAALLP